MNQKSLEEIVQFSRQDLCCATDIPRVILHVECGEQVLIRHFSHH